MKALQECWAQIDTKCYSFLTSKQIQKDSKEFPKDGSTATVCLIVGNDMYVANCGDSAAYSFSINGKVVKKLTEDHGTDNEAEAKRFATINKYTRAIC